MAWRSMGKGSPAQGQRGKCTGKTEVVQGNVGEQGQHGSGDSGEGKSRTVWIVWEQLQTWV